VFAVHPVLGASEADQKKGFVLVHIKIRDLTVDPVSVSRYG
jgi:hypothetical protein